MNRRTFVKSSLGGLAACTWLGRGSFGLALPPLTGKRVICLIMRGGYDGLSLVVPYEMDIYMNNRPRTKLEATEVYDLGLLPTRWGLHGKLESLHALWDEGRLAIINRVGYPPPANLSHFVSQDIWATMRRNTANHVSGWAGRWADAVGAPWDVAGSVVVGTPLLETKPERPLTPRALTLPSVESFDIPVVSNYPDDSDVRNRAFEAIELLGTNEDPIAEAAREANVSAFELSDLIEEAVTEEYENFLGNPDPYDPQGRPFPAKVQDVARLVAASRRANFPGTNVFFTFTGGFDTHTDQKSRLLDRWEEVDVALTGLIADLKALGEWSNTAILLFTEFGRRNVDNIDAGTDHGFGNCMLAMGGCVYGGVHHNEPDEGNLGETNLPVTHDCRHVLWEVLEDIVGVDPTVIDAVLDEVEDEEVVRLGLKAC